MQYLRDSCSELNLIKREWDQICKCYDKLSYVVTYICFQQNPRLLSPGSGNISSRYAGWGSSGMSSGAPSIGNQRQHQEDEDSGTGSTSCESHVIRHIDRNILACQICQHRYRDPKVSQIVVVLVDILLSPPTLITNHCSCCCHCRCLCRVNS